MGKTATKAGLGVMLSTVVAVALGISLPAVAAEVASVDGSSGVPKGAGVFPAEASWQNLHQGDMATTAFELVKAAKSTMSARDSGKSKAYGTIDSDAARALKVAKKSIQTKLASVKTDAVVTPQLELEITKTGLPLQIKESVPEDHLIDQSSRPDLTQLSDDPRTLSESNSDESVESHLAQFQLPKRTRPGTRPSEREALLTQDLPKELELSYAYGSDTELTYLKSPDLNTKVADDFLFFAPTFFGFIDYRPNAWFESRLELTAEWPMALKEEDRIILPNGNIQLPERYRLSLLIDQAYVTVKNKAGPFDFTVGRRNFEDDRLWLYDAALDALIVNHKQGNFKTEVSWSRENLWDLDLLTSVQKDRIDNYILYTEYRGIEDHKLGTYAIKRYDRADQEGRPLFLGVRAYGRPSDIYNYWTELGFSRGYDEFSQKLSGRGYDLGFTYRYPDRPYQPNFTLGYAYGTGDGNKDDNKNSEFRQTGLQSNEARFGGVTQFKAYGEMFDPALSNIKIFTAGVGFRTAANAFVDFVYHRYRLDEITNELRSSGVTAQMNTVESRLSKDVGSELDIIVGFRNLFGFRRFGLEVRAGVFYPGDAFYRNDGTDADPVIVPADKGTSILIVVIL